MQLPRGVLHAPEARDAKFFHQRLAPSLELTPFIQHFWYVQWDRRGLAPGSAETLPHPSCYLVFEHDLELPVEDASVVQRAEVSGVQTRKFARTLEGHGRVFGLKFQPGGMYPFLQRPVSTLTDRVLPAAEVFGPGIHALATELRSQETAEAMAATTTAYFAQCSPERHAASETATELVNAILQDSTILTVEVLARRTGQSVRALQRLFKNYVGVSPKWVIRRYRLHELLERFNTGNTLDGVQLALELGYADQAHLINDFRKLAGLSPKQYRDRIQASPTRNAGAA